MSDAVDPIPGRTEVLIANLIFVVSSVLLLLEFTSIQYQWPYDLITEGQSWNWLGALSCVGWFFGFAILIDWIVFSTFPVWGFDRQALAGATLKLIASVLFCIQPFAALAGYNPDGQPPFSGVPWSNFAGICFFHAGNMLNAIGMLKLIDTRAPFLANAPSFGMIIFACATWFLVIADGIYYFSLPKPNGPGVDVVTIIGAPLPKAVSFVVAAGKVMPARALAARAGAAKPADTSAPAVRATASAGTRARVSRGRTDLDTRAFPASEEVLA